MSKRRVIALIPCRRGSKRLPKKNWKKLCGKPLFMYSVDEALKCEFIDEIIISTDSIEIIELAKKYAHINRVRICKRPRELAQDNGLTEDVIKYHLQEYYDVEIVLLQPTSPLRTAKEIEATHKCFTKNFNSLFTINRNHKTNGNIYWFRDPNDMYKVPTYIYFQYEDISIDIDDITDFRVAEYMMERKLRNEKKRF